MAVRKSGTPPAALELLNSIGARHSHAWFTVERSLDRGEARADTAGEPGGCGAAPTTRPVQGAGHRRKVSSSTRAVA